MIYVMDSTPFANIVKIIPLELYFLKYMILYLGKKSINLYEKFKNINSQTNVSFLRLTILKEVHPFLFGHVHTTFKRDR